MEVPTVMMNVAGTFTELKRGVSGCVAVQWLDFEGLEDCAKGCICVDEVGFAVMEG